MYTIYMYIYNASLNPDHADYGLSKGSCREHRFQHCLSVLWQFWKLPVKYSANNNGRALVCSERDNLEGPPNPNG
jgi:hypothetical protein